MQPVSHEALREADQDVKLIVHSKSHFVALRQLEGEWQVNFGHKRHLWPMESGLFGGGMKSGMWT